MELKLVVLAGAKQGLEIPLKKDKFLIGRAKECALRAGSEAISRRHCAIVRAADQVTVRDLGSRNGTFVNDERIDKEVPLTVGDELRVGPLKFRIAAMSSAPAPAAEPKNSAPVPAPKSLKKAPVKDVAAAVQRTIDKAEEGATEDDVSRWLLGVPDPKSEDTLKETRTMRLEETTVNRRTVGDAPTGDEAASEESDGMAAAEPAAEEDAAEKSSGWNFFKRGKSSAGKKKPGKLPPRPESASKDSREAAADILREMTRRR
jgi:pSer/pThr/pTyr-binding forkhead associated (FHA) protein